MNFTITKPGYYRTREGKKVRVVCADNPNIEHQIIYHTDDGCVYACSVNGKHMVYGLDIVAEWIDRPIVDWSAMPAWAKYVAMDASGNWWWFWAEPRDGNEGWFSEYDSRCGRIPSDFSPSFCGDWKNSLVERPHA